MLLMFFRKMCSFSATVYGAVTFMEYLMWASLIAAMACAAWSAYKEKKRYFIYSGMCLFIFLSMLIILRIPSLPDNRAYAICYIALIIAFILAQVYSTLKIRKKFEGRWKIAFISVIFVSAIILTIAAMEPRFWEFILR